MATILLKHSSNTDVYQKTIPPNLLMNEPGFTAEKNGGQGEMTIELAVAFSNADYAPGDIVRAYEISAFHPSGVLVYTGVVYRIARYAETGERIVLRCAGLASVFSRLLHKSGSSYSFAVNQDPAETVRDIVARLNTEYPLFSAGSDIVDAGTSYAYDFDSTDCFDSVEAMRKGTTGYWWHIGADGNVAFRPKPTTATHALIIGRHIASIEVEDDLSEFANAINLTWKSETTYFQEADSVSAY